MFATWLFQIQILVMSQRLMRGSSCDLRFVKGKRYQFSMSVRPAITVLFNALKSKETNPTVLKIHKRLRNESERYLEPETRHFSGIAFFRQVRDASIHRGFYQKAVIILSQLPFHNLFRHIIDLTAPEYFSKGEAALESMAAAVNRWPSPIAGETMELPFLGSVLRVRLPAYGEAQTVR